MVKFFMNKPDVVVFDLGKVLVDFDYSIAARKIAAQSSFSPAQIQELLDHSPLLFRFEHGHLTSQEFFEEVRRESKFTAATRISQRRSRTFSARCRR